MFRVIATPSARSLAFRATDRVHVLHGMRLSRTLLSPTTRSRPFMMHPMPFHTSAPQSHPLFYAFLAGLLKSSASIEVARTATRVILTLLPLNIIRTIAVRKYLKHVVRHRPDMAECEKKMRQSLEKRAVITRLLFAIPFFIVFLTFLASLERAPITGRWRLIILSPEEEDSISNQLKGTGWYHAVLEVISKDGPPDIIPPSDWRYQWVFQVLRHLEKTIPILTRESSAGVSWLERGPDDVPLPPPSKYPLSPRPSAKDYLRWFCDSTAAGTKVPLESPHHIPGPPYNLVLVERPGCDNAFSFGFGPDGAGGIVVYSGFIDTILKVTDANTEGVTSSLETDTPAIQPPGSFLPKFLRSSFPFLFAATSTSPRAPQSTAPTPEQTMQLSILLAHELAHLILAHHLETLSSGTIVVPGMLSMFADMIRAALFPLTMLFGPFVNDAVANLGKVGSGEVARLSEYCTSVVQEFEADAVSARILAHAGFDARKTIKFWEDRCTGDLSECSPFHAAQRKARLSALQTESVAANEEGPAVDEEMLLPPARSEILSLSTSLAHQIVGATHPLHESRVLRLRSELQRWEKERQMVLKKQKQKADRQGFLDWMWTFGKGRSTGP